MVNIIRSLLLIPTILSFLFACENSQNQDNTSLNVKSNNVSISEETKQALKIVRDSRIFFMHHSVGANILTGFQSMADDTGIGINIKPLEHMQLSETMVFIDATGGRNKYPKTKVDSFAGQIKEFNEEKVPDLAFMKFCFVDFSPNTDIDELFLYYRKSIDSIKKERPDITIAHLTVPLVERPHGIKDRINRLLGRQVWEDEANVRRAEFNKMIIDNFRKDPVFDLARVESTFPNGSRASFVFNGKKYHSLVSEYTDDSGHLNELGQRYVATAMAKFLADTIKAKHENP